MLTKKKQLVSVRTIIFLFLWAIAVFSYDIADYENYKLIYSVYLPKSFMTAFYSFIDIGFILLCKIASILGLSFSLFRGIYLTCALWLLFKGINYWSEKGIFVYCLYAFYPFLLDIVQFRYFLAYSIVLYATRFLKTNEIKKYIIFIILAATQHFLVLVYLMFLLFNLKIDKLKITVITVTLCEIIAFLFAMPNIVNLLGNFIPRLSLYSSANVSIEGITFFIEYLVMGIVILIFALAVHKTDLDQEVFDFLVKLSVIAICFIPFILIDDDYVRLYRGVLPLIYVMLYTKLKDRRYTVLTNIFIIAVVGLLFYIHLSPHSVANYQAVTKPIFENNYFIELFR